MTTKQADRAIKSGEPIAVEWPDFRSHATIVIVRRDRHNIYTADGGKYDRADTVISIPAAHT